LNHPAGARACRLGLAPNSFPHSRRVRRAGRSAGNALFSLPIIFHIRPAYEASRGRAYHHPGICLVPGEYNRKFFSKNARCAVSLRLCLARAAGKVGRASRLRFFSRRWKGRRDVCPTLWWTVSRCNFPCPRSGHKGVCANVRRTETPAIPLEIPAKVLNGGLW